MEIINKCIFTTGCFVYINLAAICETFGNTTTAGDYIDTDYDYSLAGYDDQDQDVLSTTRCKITNIDTNLNVTLKSCDDNRTFILSNKEFLISASFAPRYELQEAPECFTEGNWLIRDYEYPENTLNRYWTLENTIQSGNKKDMLKTCQELNQKQWYKMLLV